MIDSQPGELDISDAELACLTETVGEDSVVMALTMPETATEEDAAALLTCMEDDTLLRWYLTPFLQQTGALSPESSSCIRSGFATTDIAALMLAVATGQGGEPSDEAAAMMTAMAGFLVTLSCLNEEEFLSAAPALGIAPEEQARFPMRDGTVGRAGRNGSPHGPRRLARLCNYCKRQRLAKSNWAADSPPSSVIPLVAGKRDDTAVRPVTNTNSARTVIR